MAMTPHPRHDDGIWRWFVATSAAICFGIAAENGFVACGTFFAFAFFESAIRVWQKAAR